MKILLDDVKLTLLLEQKKQFIGTHIVWDSILSAASFLMSVLLATYPDILFLSGTVLKTVFVMLGLIFTGKSILDVHSSLKNSYTHEDLFSDINKLNEITHNHSIVAIKDSFEKFPNRFLVYYDTRWECFLFLNFKTNVNNESFIINGLSHQLKTDRSNIRLDYISQMVHEKYSESHQESRVYCHRLYTAELTVFSPEIKFSEFTLDGIQYRWMSIAEMESDNRTMTVNSDIINFVKENIN